MTESVFQGRSLLSTRDYTKDELMYLIGFAEHLKDLKKWGVEHRYLAGKNIALLFEKTSTRTRAAFTTACIDLGAHPEYLGKKVEGREMKMAVLVLIIHPLLILGFSALAVGTEAGRAGITNPGFHGLSQVLYEYSSSAANNGSGFEGLADNTYFWNITAGLAMFFGRYLAIVLQLAIAWSLLCKKRMNESIGTLKTNNIGFGVIVAFVVYIFAALTFFPALALGPIAEHLSIWLPV